MSFERYKRSIIPKILVPKNFYTYTKQTDFSSIPNIRSFMLTAAVEVFECFISLQLRFAHYTSLNKNFMQLYLQTHSFGNAETKCVMHRDIFLFNFSTMLSHILSVNNFDAHVIVCRKCVRKFIRKCVFEFKEKTLENRKVVFSLVDFICDEVSIGAFQNFAKYIFLEKLINDEPVCFDEMLTYDADSMRIDWRILTWAWVHQVFYTLSTFETDYENIDHVYYFVKTLVFNVFTQLKCYKCAIHSYYSHLEDSFEKDFLLYIMDIITLYPKYWNEYGFMLHSVVNTRVMYGADRTGLCRLILYDEYEKNVLPNLIQNKLKQIFGIRQLYNIECKTKLYDNYASALLFKNTFYDDKYYDLDTIEIANNFLTKISRQKAKEKIEQKLFDAKK